MDSDDRGSVYSLYYEAQEDEHSKVSMTREEEKRQKMLNSKWFLVRLRQQAGDFVNSTILQLIVIGLIVINAIIMAVATFDFVTDDPHVEKIFETIDIVFLSVFTAELALQFIYRGLTLFQDGWLVFDFVIILLSWSFNQLQVIRAFRIFRAIRLVTRVKILRDLVAAIMAVLPRMTAIGALLLLIFYVYSVLFVELFGNLELSENYFKTLDASLFTCFQMMTMEWADLARECQETYSYAPIVFVSFIMISGFIGTSLYASKRNKQNEIDSIVCHLFVQYLI
jgi:uncharacterized membrane protein YphA (DoxX/SURF4 family)